MAREFDSVVPFPKAIRYLSERGISHSILERLKLEIAPATRLTELGFKWPNLDHGVVWHIRDIKGVLTGKVGARVWYKINPFAPPGSGSGDKPKFLTPKGQDPGLYYSPLAAWDVLKPNRAVYLCESYLKADILCALGYYAVGIVGINGASYKKDIIPDLSQLALMGHEIIVFFDSNVWSGHPHNLRAVEDLKAEFDNIRCALSWVPLPPKVDGSLEDRTDWGIDDFYMTQGLDSVTSLLVPENKKSVVTGLQSMLRVFNREVVFINDLAVVAEEKSGTLYTTQKAVRGRWANRLFFEMDDDKAKKINLCQAWLEHKERRNVPRIEYQPGCPRVQEDEFFNLWNGWGVEPASELDTCIKLWESWLVDAFPDEEERDWFVSWLAWPIQNPRGRMTQACILLGKPGVGKGWVASILNQIYGYDNVANVDLAVLAKSFNADYAAKHMVIVEESDAVWRGDHKSVNNRIKDFITQERRRVEKKGVDAFTIPAVGHLFMQGNDIDVVKLDEEDRRVGVLWIDGDGFGNDIEYWGPRWTWLHDLAAEEIMRWLLDYKIERFNPYGVPLMTAAKKRMIETTKGSLEGWVDELIRNHQGMLVNPSTGEEYDSQVWTAKELRWLYEASSDMPFRDVPQRDSHQMARELNSRFCRMVNRGDKVSIRAIRGSNVRIASTRFFILGEFAEPREGWATYIRNRKVSRELYGT